MIMGCYVMTGRGDSYMVRPELFVVYGEPGMALARRPNRMHGEDDKLSLVSRRSRIGMSKINEKQRKHDDEPLGRGTTAFEDSLALG
jgi:hypothetical protein